MIPDKVYNILVDVIPMVVLFSIVMSTVRIITMLYSHEKIVLHNEIKNLLYIIYCFILFVLVTSTDFESYSNNFVPFKEISRYSITSNLFYRNVLGNIILFLPFGYLITDMIQTKANKCNVFISLLITTITSLSIELIQFFIGRSFDIDDIILNLVGGLLGYLLYKIGHFILNKLKNKFNNVLVNLVSFLFIIILFILLFFVCYEVVV